MTFTKLAITVVAVTIFFAVTRANAQVFPFIPKLTASAVYRHNGNLNMMIPIWGDTTGHFYTTMEGQYDTDKSAFASIGLGQRQLFLQNLLLGAYGFMDRNQVVHGEIKNRFWVFNPGLEFMTSTWDGHLNGYFPVSANKQPQGLFLGEQIGKNDTISFSDHQKFDHIFHQSTLISTGADIDIGYIFKPTRVRIHGGGYRFDFPDNVGSISGLQAGIEIPVNHHLAFGLSNTYDNIQKYNLFASIKLTLGGIAPTDRLPVQERLLDPIPRHLGTQENSSGIPSRTLYTDTHQIVLSQDNIWFFNPDNHSQLLTDMDASCTFEHPCDFNQSVIDQINTHSPNANLYFSPGHYSHANNSLILNNGQSVYGRTADYKQAASLQTGLPDFQTTITPEGNNIIDAISLNNNNNTETTGIAINHANNIIINHVNINGFSTPINIRDAQHIAIQNTVLTATGENDIYGIDISNDDLDNKTDVYLANNIFNLNSDGNFIAGINNTSYTGGNIAVTLNNNIFNLSANRNNAFLAGVNTVLFSNGLIDLSLNQNQFNLQTNNDLAYGINLNVYNTGVCHVDLNNNDFRLNDSNPSGNNRSTGIYASASDAGVLMVNANHNKFDLSQTSLDGLLYGIQTLNQGEAETSVNIKNNRFDFTSPDLSHQISLDNHFGGIIQNQGGNQFFFRYNL